MRIFSPREWGARVDYDLWDDRYTPDDGVALHHGGSADYPAGRPPFTWEKEVAQLRSWEQYHLSKGWRGLAYGWGVGQTGNVYRIRGWNSYGAHTGDVDGDGISNNSEIVPIIFLGSGNHTALSPAAQASIATLRREVIQVRAPKAIWLYGHQELKGTATSCPGPLLMDYVRTHRRLSEPGVPTVAWQPGTPIDTLAMAKAFFEYLGPSIYKTADFAYDENNPALMDERMKILIARVGAILVQHDTRIRAEEAEKPTTIVQGDTVDDTARELAAQALAEIDQVVQALHKAAEGLESAA